MSKQFRLKASEIRPLVEGYGACLASDHITVDGKCVGFMYREAGDGSHDGGWRFFPGMSRKPIRMTLGNELSMT
jgi:hypothetical protein